MISEVIKNQFFLEMCQKHEEGENPYLDIKDLKINKYFFTENGKRAYFEVKYQFKLTSRMNSNVYQELNRTKMFFYDDLISTIRERRLDNLLS